MKVEKTQVLTAHVHFELRLTATNELILTWRGRPGVTDAVYKEAIRSIANHSLAHRPRLVVVDKRRRQDTATFDHPWWQREILPRYHQAGFRGIAHVVAHPPSAGPLPPLPGVRFAMAEFPDLESALAWSP